MQGRLSAVEIEGFRLYPAKIPTQTRARSLPDEMYRLSSVVSEVAWAIRSA
jgi:hypothetical protein